MSRKWLQLIVLGGFLTGIGVLISLVLSRFDQPEIEIISGSNPSNSSISPNPSSKIIVDVSGAVVHPGIYSLSIDSRLNDALTAAAGLAANADRDYVSQSLNLAQKIIDGSKIYIPSLGENKPVFSSKSLNSSNSLIQAISINSSSLSDLDTLTGVGTVRAQAVIAGRPYSRVEELVERKIIPQSVFDKNKDKLAL